MHSVMLCKVLFECIAVPAEDAGGCVVELDWTGGLDSRMACHGCWGIWTQWTVDIWHIAVPQYVYVKQWPLRISSKLHPGCMSGSGKISLCTQKSANNKLRQGACLIKKKEDKIRRRWEVLGVTNLVRSADVPITNLEKGHQSTACVSKIELSKELSK